MDRLTVSSGATPAAPGAPVDLVFLARQTGENKALASEVLELFTRQNQIYIDRLKQVQNGTEWYEICHGFKGSSREIGAFSLAEVIERCETLASVEADEVAPSIRDIEDSAAVVNDFIRQMLKN